jgi:methyl-accepting chemotaxis protein
MAIIDSETFFGIPWAILGIYLVIGFFLAISSMVVFLIWFKRDTLAFKLAGFAVVSVLPLSFMGLVIGANTVDGFVVINDEGEISASFINIFVASLLAISLFIWLNYEIRNAMGKHFDVLNQMAQNVAEGSLIIPKDTLKVSSNDVLYGFYSGFERMILELQSIIEDILSAATRVASTAEEIAASSSEVSSSSENISAIMENISQGTQEQVARASDAQNSSSSLGGIINNSFTEIEEVLQLTLAIAEETNLLALNAAIEAQRAGEAGRGFSIVAQNVRRLADDSRNYADQIERVIQEAATKIQDGQKNIEAAITQIAEVSEDVATASEEVAASAEEQTATMEELVAATSELSSLSSQLENRLQKFQVK